MSFAGICFIFLGLGMLFLSLIFWFGNATIGITFLIIGLICFIASIAFIALHRKKRQAMENERLEKEKNFELWLTQQGFTVSDNTEGFLVDTVNKKWCKKFENKIFDFSEAVGADINKHRSSTTSSTGSSSSRGSSSSHRRSGLIFNASYGSGSSRRRRSGSSTRTSKDTSTYEVLIKTNNITSPLVSIYCGMDKASAEKIRATVDIMRGKKTRNNAKETNINDGQSGCAD